MNADTNRLIEKITNIDNIMFGVALYSSHNKNKISIQPLCNAKILSEIEKWFSENKCKTKRMKKSLIIYLINCTVKIQCV